MINLNKIRSLKTLETIRKTLMDFLNYPNMLKVYENEFGWNEDDYSVDCDLAKELLEKVEHRIKSLTRHLNKVRDLSAKENSNS
jgi:hypothetical protein